MKISLNKQVFSFLLENEKKLSEFEEYLLGKIPWAFVNFLGLDNALIEIIFKTQSSFIKSKLDYSNTNITQAIQNFVQVANYIQSQFDIAQDIKLNFLETFESSFLFAMFLAQNLRVTLLQPQYSAFQFEKILSVAEKKVFKSSKNQFREEDMPAFQLSENILTDDFGQVDIQKTKELEEQKNEIKIFFSSFDSVFHQTKYLKVNMQNRSKHIVFAMLNPKLCETICSACSSIIVEKYAKSVYHQLKTNPNLEEVTQKTQNYLKETALAYIRRTQNIQDPFKLKEDIKKTTLEILAEERDFDEKLNFQIAEDVFENALKNAILKWVHMPSNFYKFEFRDVRAEEKTYHEAEYALDIFLIKPNGRIQTEMFETYILTMTEDSRNIIYTMASKDIQNSKLIQNQIDRYFEPMPFSRFVKKVNDLTYKLNTN